MAVKWLNEDFSRGISFVIEVTYKSLKESVDLGLKILKTTGVKVQDNVTGFVEVGLNSRLEDVRGESSIRFKVYYANGRWYDVVWFDYVDLRDSRVAKIHMNYYDSDFTFKEFGGISSFNNGILTNEMEFRLNDLEEVCRMANLDIVNSYVNVFNGRVHDDWVQAQ